MAMALLALIVDDEPPARMQLRRALEKFPDVQVVGEATNGREAMQLVGALDYDVLFMDIRMPGIDGLAVAQQLKGRRRAPRIVFVTAHADYALPAFDYRAFDYLLKPFDDDRLGETVQRLREVQAGQSGGGSAAAAVPAEGGQGAPAGPSPDSLRLLAQRDDIGVPVALSEIVYIESQGDLVMIHTRDERLPGRYTIQELTEWLPPQSFFRCHRSFIVNIAHIREIAPMFNGTYLLRMKDGSRSEVPVSRRHTARLKRLFYLPDRKGE